MRRCASRNRSHGLKVLELARMLAGPWAGQVLADLGADVVKVERPGGGDDTRGWGPPFVEDERRRPCSAAYFHASNRGKRSIAVDFEHGGGPASSCRRLAPHADVLIENFKVGGLAKYGLDYDEPEGDQSAPHLLLDHRLRPERALRRAPRLRLHRSRAWAGSWTDRRAGRRAAENRRRLRRYFHRRLRGRRDPGGARSRERDRRGAHIDMALARRPGTSVLANQAMNYLVVRRPRRGGMGNAHPNIVALSGFPAADWPCDRRRRQRRAVRALRLRVAGDCPALRNRRSFQN